MPNLALRRLKIRAASGGGGGGTPVDPGDIPAGILAAIPASSSSIALSLAPVDGADSYAFERSSDATTWTAVGTSSTPAYDDTGLAPATRYYHRAHAISGGMADAPTFAARSVTRSSPGGTLATVGLGIGWNRFGQVFTPGALPSGQSAVVSGLSTQCDVLATHPDGSAKFAVLSCKASSASSKTVAAGTPASGSFTPTAPSATTTITMKTLDPFQLLGTFTVGGGGTLQVVLSNNTPDAGNGRFPLADAARIVRVSDDAMTTIDNTGADAGRVASASVSGFSCVGLSWQGYDGQGGVSNTTIACQAVTGAATNTATWTFAGLSAGSYRAYASWPAKSDGSTATPFAVKVGGSQVGTYSADMTVQSGATVPAGPVYSASLPSGVSSDVWLSGPLLKHWRRLVTPLRTDDGSNTAHPVMRVRYDVDVASDGACRVDVAVENILDAAQGTEELYDVDIAVSGSSRYSRSDLRNGWLCRWRAVVDPAGAFAGPAAPDVDAWESAEAIPKYIRAKVPDVVLSATGPSYSPLGKGGLPYNGMATPGEDIRFGPLPWWTAYYVAHRRPEMLAVILANGDLSGSWPIHLDAGSGEPISIEARPGYWWDLRGNPGEKPAGNLTRVGVLSPDNAHTSSLAYVPYLITGDRYYADEMKHWAAWGVAQNSPGYRGIAGNASAGIILVAAIQTRALAWQLRDLAQPAAYLPDSDPFKAYFARVIGNNLDWMDAAPDGPIGGTLGFPDESGAATVVAVWQLGYLNWALEHLYRLGVPGAGTRGRRAQAKTMAFTQQFWTNPGAFSPLYACMLSRGRGSTYIGGGYAELYHPPGPTGTPYPSLAAYYAGDVLPYVNPTPDPNPYNYAIQHWATASAGSWMGVPGCSAATATILAATDPGDSQPAVDKYLASRHGYAIDLS